MAFQTFDPYNYISIQWASIRLTRRFCELNQVTSDMRALLGYSLQNRPTITIIIEIIPADTYPEVDGEKLGSFRLHGERRETKARYQGVLIHCADLLKRVASRFNVDRSALAGKYSYTRKTGKLGDVYAVDLKPIEAL